MVERFFSYIAVKEIVRHLRFMYCIGEVYVSGFETTPSTKTKKEVCTEIMLKGPFHSQFVMTMLAILGMDVRNINKIKKMVADRIEAQVRSRCLQAIGDMLDDSTTLVLRVREQDDPQTPWEELASLRDHVESVTLQIFVNMFRNLGLCLMHEPSSDGHEIVVVGVRPIDLKHAEHELYQVYKDGDHWLTEQDAHRSNVYPLKRIANRLKLSTGKGF